MTTFKLNTFFYAFWHPFIQIIQSICRIFSPNFCQFFYSSSEVTGAFSLSYLWTKAPNFQWEINQDC
uniref:Uncharacterized protein n=1 Tax=Lepeophtheirus salmonis TaxID=72036 RepID=A0A0K2UAD5_LEPSM